MRKAHKLCDDHEDSGTASLLEVFIDETSAAPGSCSKPAPGRQQRGVVLSLPLVGEGGEGFSSAEKDPSSAFASRRHLLPQGEKGIERRSVGRSGLAWTGAAARK